MSLSVYGGIRKEEKTTIIKEEFVPPIEREEIHLPAEVEVEADCGRFSIPITPMRFYPFINTGCTEISTIWLGYTGIVVNPFNPDEFYISISGENSNCELCVDWVIDRHGNVVQLPTITEENRTYPLSQIYTMTDEDNNLYLYYVNNSLCFYNLTQKTESCAQPFSDAPSGNEKIFFYYEDTPPLISFNYYNFFIRLVPPKKAYYTIVDSSTGEVLYSKIFTPKTVQESSFNPQEYLLSWPSIYGIDKTRGGSYLYTKWSGIESVSVYASGNNYGIIGRSVVSSTEPCRDVVPCGGNSTNAWGISDPQYLLSFAWGFAMTTSFSSKAGLLLLPQGFLLDQWVDVRYAQLPYYIEWKNMLIPIPREITFNYDVYKQGLIEISSPAFDKAKQKVIRYEFKYNNGREAVFDKVIIDPTETIADVELPDPLKWPFM